MLYVVLDVELLKYRVSLCISCLNSTPSRNSFKYAVVQACCQNLALLFQLRHHVVCRSAIHMILGLDHVNLLTIVC